LTSTKSLCHNTFSRSFIFFYPRLWEKNQFSLIVQKPFDFKPSQVHRPQAFNLKITGKPHSEGEEAVGWRRDMTIQNS